MDYRRFDNRVVVRIARGEEIVETLREICKDLGITLGFIMGVGATDDATIGLFDVKMKQYRSKDLHGDHEIASLLGNITLMDGKLYLHLHAVLCDVEQRAFGGHLDRAVVSATFEGVIDVIDGVVERVFDEKTGLNLLEF